MMPANEFMRRRDSIERQHKRPKWWHRRAFDRLLREAVAVPVVAAKRVVGYKLGSGEVVCIKRRFANEENANDTIHMIHDEHQPRFGEPTRCYQCAHCKGWHITSQDRK